MAARTPSRGIQAARNRRARESNSRHLPEKFAVRDDCEIDPASSDCERCDDLKLPGRVASTSKRKRARGRLVERGARNDFPSNVEHAHHVHHLRVRVQRRLESTFRDVLRERRGL